MARLDVRSVIQILVLFAVCVASAAIGFASRSNNANVSIPTSSKPLVLRQLDEKVIERRKYSNEPFEFSDLSVKKIKVSPGQKLSARALAESGGGKVEDWLENLSFTIKNTTDKQITYINYILEFTETGVGRPMMQYVLDKGLHPTAPEIWRKYIPPLALNPGDSFTFELSAEELQQIQKFLEQGSFQLANLNKVNIHIDTVIFADGMKWSQGDLYKPAPGEQPAPGKPGKYERVIQ